MKKSLLFLFVLVISHYSNAQRWKDVLKKVTKDSSIGNLGNVINTAGSSGLSNSDIVSGLKEALQVGVEKSTARLSSPDGFFKDAAVKILLPEEAKTVETKLRALGMGKQVDNAVLSINRAAEQASTKAAPIFINAIKSMSINDATGILRGGDSSATRYLRSKTSNELTSVFKPVVENALTSTNATKYWKSLFSAYNQFTTKKVNTDLTGYVTEKALSGIFLQVGKEEQLIRQDPAARTTEILKKVFSK